MCSGEGYQHKARNIARSPENIPTPRLHSLASSIPTPRAPTFTVFSADHPYLRPPRVLQTLDDLLQLLRQSLGPLFPAFAQPLAMSHPRRDGCLCSLKILHGQAEAAQLLVRLGSAHQCLTVAGLDDQSSDCSKDIGSGHQGGGFVE